MWKKLFFKSRKNNANKYLPELPEEPTDDIRRDALDPLIDHDAPSRGTSPQKSLNNCPTKENYARSKSRQDDNCHLPSLEGHGSELGYQKMRHQSTKLGLPRSKGQFLEAENGTKHARSGWNEFQNLKEVCSISTQTLEYPQKSLSNRSTFHSSNGGPKIQNSSPNPRVECFVRDSYSGSLRISRGSRLVVPQGGRPCTQPNQRDNPSMYASFDWAHSNSRNETYNPPNTAPDRNYRCGVSNISHQDSAEAWLMTTKSGSDDLGYEGSSLGSTYSPYNTNRTRESSALLTDTENRSHVTRCVNGNDFEAAIDIARDDNYKSSTWDEMEEGCCDDFRRRTLTETLSTNVGEQCHQIVSYQPDHQMDNRMTKTCNEKRDIPWSPALRYLPKFIPLTFNLNYLERDTSIFIGREWLFQRICQVLNTSETHGSLSTPRKGMIILGRRTSGKSAIIHHIVKHSRFGHHFMSPRQSTSYTGPSLSTAQPKVVPSGWTMDYDNLKTDDRSHQHQYRLEATALLQKRRLLLTPQIQRRRPSNNNLLTSSTVTVQPFMTPTVPRKQVQPSTRNFGTEGSSPATPSIYNAPSTSLLGKSPESMVRRKTMLSSSMSFRRVSPPHTTATEAHPDCQEGGGTTDSSGRSDASAKRSARPIPNSDAQPFVRELGSRLLAYHICQREDFRTRSVPMFVRNMIHQVSYESLPETNHSDPDLESPDPLLLLCHKDPLGAFYRHVIERLLAGRSIDSNYVIAIDGLEDCGGDGHRTFGNLYDFVVYSCLPILPHWVRIIMTCRTDDVTNPPSGGDTLATRLCAEEYARVSIDYGDDTAPTTKGKVCTTPVGNNPGCGSKTSSETYGCSSGITNSVGSSGPIYDPQERQLQQLLAREDMYRYIGARIEGCPATFHENIVGSSGGPTQALNPAASSRDDVASTASDTSADSSSLKRFDPGVTRASHRGDYERQLQAASLLPRLVDWLVDNSRGDLLYVASILDMLQRGELVVKNASFKILPRGMEEILGLTLNRAFSTQSSFSRVRPALNALLAAYSTSYGTSQGVLESALHLRNQTTESIPPKVNFSGSRSKSHSESSDELEASWDNDLSILEDDEPKPLLTTNFSTNVFLSPKEMIDILLKHGFVVLGQKYEKLGISNEPNVPETGTIIHFSHPYVGEWFHRNGQPGNVATEDRFACDIMDGHVTLGMYYASLSANISPTDELYDNVIESSVQHLSMAYGANPIPQDLISPENLTRILSSPANVYGPDLKTSQFLLVSGADPNARISYESNHPTLLMFAATKPDYLAFADLLLTSGADPNLCDEVGANCAIYASKSGNVKLLNRFLRDRDQQALALLTHRDDRGKCALIYAVQNNHYDATSFLLRNYVSQITASRSGMTCELSTRLQRAFFVSVTQGCVAICKLILTYTNQCIKPTVIIDGVDKCTGLTPLCAAIMTTGSVKPTTKTSQKLAKSTEEIIKFLIDEAEADIEGVCYSHAGSEEITSTGQNVDILKISTPLMCAASKSDLGTVDLLIERHKLIIQPSKLKQFLDRRDGDDRSALIKAASVGANDIVERLLCEGANIALIDTNGKSALHWASKGGHSTVVRSLIDKAPYLVNILDKDGRTPLHLASSSGFKIVVQALIDEGSAHMDVLDNEGLSPMDIAVKTYLALVDNRGSVNQNGRQYLTLVANFLQRGAKIRSSVWKILGESNPGSVPVLLMYKLFLNKLSQDGHVLAKNNKIEESIYRYEYAIKHFPLIPEIEGAVIVERGSGSGSNCRENGLESLDILIKSFKELQSHLLINLSRYKLNQQNFAAAIEYATKALEIKPNFFEAYYIRAKANKYNNQIIPALKDILEAQEIDPENAQFKSLLANLKESIISHAAVTVN